MVHVMVHAVVTFPPWYYLTNPNGFLQRHDRWSRVDIWWINLQFLDLSTYGNIEDIVCPPFIHLYQWKDIVYPSFIHFQCCQNLWFINILSTIHLVYPPFNHSIVRSPNKRLSIIYPFINIYPLFFHSKMCQKWWIPLRGSNMRQPPTHAPPLPTALSWLFLFCLTIQKLC